MNLSPPPRRNPNSGCGLAFAIGALVLVGILFAVFALGSNAAHTLDKASQQSSKKSAQSDWCDVANASEKASVDAINAGSWDTAYHYAVKGLVQNAGCSSDQAALVNKAYLMTMKARAERHLSEGDSATDLNEADTLLQECQTTPGLYGTHVGAQCETQQESNIREKMSWETGAP